MKLSLLVYATLLIRGVNLGSLFIIEPWMTNDTCVSMGCDKTKSESDCVVALGQDAANNAFQKHWDTYITEQDLDDIKAYGLNTIRVPVGFWMLEDLIHDDEHFPQGGLKYLDRLAGWAADRNIYVILDLHGAPGAQDAKQPFTGQYVSEATFYTPPNYTRACKFLQFMTSRIHTTAAYRTTGMLEVVNEPQRNHPDLVSTYYATAYAQIRAIESKLNILDAHRLTIQFMDKAWGAGNAADVVGTNPKAGVAYDRHNYLKYANIAQTKDAYINASCATVLGDGGDTPTVVGEWSIAVGSKVQAQPQWDPTKEGNKEWYTRYWAAQVSAYEKGAGWVFWSWKTELGGNWRWSYKAAVAAGVIPKDLGEATGLAGC
ncbi:glycoside hydrolase family 5 protein [Lophiostoma macrostomum CBS 122681]|uniref:glucan endo-1,6-beta-glucosidase n=1 Tax=Lophiostoma macrostomum CBS 122681 TaxID=1314788 RepID=A0A6A6TSR0_9PLEO|nr:glycoside hydrolase family 5 protein [Lophiostoma macrostomum CBS 122681]